MTHGLCNLSVIPLRPEPSHRSEMVSQLLFGDLFEVFEQFEEWIRIKCEYDLYEGWILASQCTPLSIEEFREIKGDSPFVACDNRSKIQINQTPVQVLTGCTLPLYKSGRFTLKGQTIPFDGEVINTSKAVPTQKIVAAALRFLGSPYLWGGKTVYGVDCSGFVQVIYKLAGIRLSRDSHEQADEGSHIGLLEEAAEGDLAFFDNKEGKIMHVGILLNDNKIIHASGKVRIDKIDHHGIYNADTASYSHNLRLLRRVI